MMERSRSKRNYYYDQDCEGEEMMTARSKPRFNTHQTQNHHYGANNHHHRYHRGSRDSSSNSRAVQQDPSSLMVTTSYRILCHDVKMGGVIGKSGSIIKAIRQHTGAWINVHELKPGDEERIIEITDTRRRDPEGRIPAFSPAQEALTLIHERILETEGGLVDGGDEEDYEGMRRGGNRVVTRLVVSRMHVGCLMGKGGKIIEQMRIETKTQIRILPRDHNLPRCVSMSEEIVQVVGDMNNVKNAVALISSRLRESQHRDRSHFQGRVRSPERFFRDDDYTLHNGNGARRSPMDFGSRGYRKNNYSSRASSYAIDSGTAPIADDMQPVYVEDLVFRILCPIEKIDSVIGESDSIVDLLLNEIGVDVRVTDPVSGSEEQVIMISSGEGPHDELFPAQEALLHIQNRIVDLAPDKDNIITTRLLVPSSDMECLEGRDGPISEIRRLTGANIQILPREERPPFVSRNDEIVQIVGGIKAARDALIEVTTRLRSYSFREFFQKGTSAPLSAPPLVGNTTGMETISPSHLAQARDCRAGSFPHLSTHKNVQNMATSEALKEARDSSAESRRQNEGDRREDVPSTISRIAVPLVTRSTLEVALPEYAVPKLVSKSKNKLAQISELSGANVTLLEDRPESTQKIIQISGTPEQAEKAQRLLQGFILSTQDE